MKYVLACLVLLGLSTSVLANHCRPKEEAYKILRENHKEEPFLNGLAGNSIFELWVSPTGTWTVLTTHPNGLTCVRLSGDSFEPVKAAPKGEAL